MRIFYVTNEKGDLCMKTVKEYRSYINAFETLGAKIDFKLKTLTTEEKAMTDLIDLLIDSKRRLDSAVDLLDNTEIHG